ncbi:hypothetical protein GGI25_003469 [Coemansia spiralis]|uniref:C3H1-type domain-containing protein n=2 Tax=Coemansia TaxID=4863 RepID=A0A9W8KXI8_9FUNG|nr:hypothetical protein EDC05_003410 [Coemansia umbellata]KAJ2621560.1 hypothetical protein GGI26_004023 [Coemansia sp. RSA 1358]KAJ2676717.1 hypothetical protein GGI25_003469 [Coemansia spiralis]
MSRPQPSQRQPAKEATSSATPAPGLKPRQRTQLRDSSSSLMPEQHSATDDSENEDGGFDDSSTGVTSSIKSRQRQQQARSSSAASTEQDSSDQRAQRGGGGHKGGSTKHIPCKFYKHGNCTAGANCFFSHDISLFVDKSVCKYFVKGNCRYGNKCALLHTNQLDGNISVRPAAKSSNGTRIAQNNNRTAGANNGNASLASKGNLRGGLSSGNAAKKDRAIMSEASYSDAAAGRIGASSSHSQSSHENKPSAQSSKSAVNSQGTTSSNGAASSASVHDDSEASIGSNDSDAASVHPSGAWTPGSIASALRKNHSQKHQLQSSAPKRRSINNDSGMFEAGYLPMHGLANHDSDSIDNLLFGEYHGSSSASPLRAHFDSAGISGLSSSHTTNTQSQPIPKPDASGFTRAFRGGDSSVPYGGLSMQDSMRIDNLALSHGAAHQQFAGSPFMSSSIPLLDQFKDLARAEAAVPSSGNSPIAQSFSRSPAGDSSSYLLNRHAFTAVNASASLQDTLMLDDTGGSLLSGHHGSLHNQQNANLISASMRSGADGIKINNHHLDMSPAIDPIGNARSIPRNTELFGRSFRSSSFVNESLNPLAALAATATEYSESGTSSRLHSGAPLGSPVAGANPSVTTGGRLRSNSHILSPTLSGISSGLDFTGISKGGNRNAASSLRHSAQDSPFLASDGQLGAFSLTDIHSIPYDTTLKPASGNGVGATGFWDSYGSYSGVDLSLEQEQRTAYGHSLGSQTLGAQLPTTGFGQPAASNLGQHPQYQQQLQSWAQSVKAQRQAGNQPSPFTSAIGSYSEHKSIVTSQLDSVRPGAIGQKPRLQHNPIGTASGLSSSYTSSTQIGGAFGGIGLSLSGASSTRANSNNNNNSFLTTTNGKAGHNHIGGSINGSSAASDNCDDMFELEQDTPARAVASNGMSKTMAPNPQFISMEGFAQKFSDLTTLSRPEGGKMNVMHSESISSVPIPGVSAISRPSI